MWKQTISGGIVISFCGWDKENYLILDWRFRNSLENILKLAVNIFLLGVFSGKMQSVQTFNNFHTSVNSNCTAVEGNIVILRMPPFHIGVKGHS